VEHTLAPTPSVVPGQFEDGAVSISTAVSGRAIEISSLIKNQVGIGASTSAAELVQRLVLVLRPRTRRCHQNGHNDDQSSVQASQGLSARHKFLPGKRLPRKVSELDMPDSATFYTGASQTPKTAPLMMSDAEFFIFY
jgi:hypothetical protein